MNYIKIYENLVCKAQNRVLEKPFESHHIIPKCMGGSNDKENLINLTPEEHCVAHQLLVKINPTNKGLIYAAMMMTAARPNMPRNNKTYGWLRRLASEPKRNVKFTDERKRKISEATKGRAAPNKLTWDELKYSTQCNLYGKNDPRVPEGWQPVKVRGTAESSARISAAQKGKTIPLSERKSHGKTWTEERKQEQSKKIKELRANKFWSSGKKNNF